MRLPDFLIIGAMKAGTTSMYFDLLNQPDVFMSAAKEPGNLLTDVVLTAQGRSEYARHFARAQANQVCGEASTDYSKLPDEQGVVPRATALLGERLRIIYLVREPVARLVSQHRHELHLDKVDCNIDDAVRQWPRYINYSRYAMQIRPWMEALGPERVRVVRFEDYTKNRQSTVDALLAFLGVDANADGRTLVYERTFNRFVGKRVLERQWKWLRRTFIYRYFLRHVPGTIKDRLQALLPRPRLPIDPPSPQTVRHIIDELAPDVEELAVLTGKSEPLWNLEEVARRYQINSADR